MMQGADSLGIFSCGIFKSLVKEKIRLDVAAGISIGAPKRKIEVLKELATHLQKINDMFVCSRRLFFFS
jgi:hypothetical protein